MGTDATRADAGPAARRELWADRLRAVSPVGLFFSPVFRRDAAIIARRRGTYWVRAGFALFMLLVVGLTFWGMSAGAQTLGGAARVQALQRLAPGVALAMAWVQFVGLVFIAPNFTASALTDEKRNRTLATLASTPLTSAEIVFGLFASRWAQLGLVSLVAVPLLLALRAFGGLEAEYILGTTALALSAAALAVALTLLGGTFAARASGATGFALGGLLAVVALPPLTSTCVHYVLGTRAGPWESGLLTLCSPLGSMGAVALSGVAPRGLPLGLTFTQMWLAATGVNLALAVGVCGLASVLLRRVMLRVAATEATAPVRSGPKRRAPALPAPAAPQPDAGERVSAGQSARRSAAEARASRTVSDHPVLWREVRQRAFRMPAVMLVVFIAAAVGTAIIHWVVSDHRAITLGIAGVCVFVHVLLACGAATGAVTDEVQGRTWGVLLTTTLRPREILLGKAIGAARRLSPIPVYVLVVLTIKTVLGHFNPIGLVHVALIFAGVAALLCPLGAFFSLVCRKTTTATSLNMLVAAFLWLGLPMLVAVVFLTGLVGPGWTWLSNLIMRAVVAINPLQLLPEAVQGAYASAGIAPLSYRLSGGTPLGVWGFSLVVVTFTALCTAGGAGALWLAERVFPRYALRAL